MQFRCRFMGNFSATSEESLEEKKCWLILAPATAQACLQSGIFDVNEFWDNVVSLDQVIAGLAAMNPEENKEDLEVYWVEQTTQTAVVVPPG